jgi:hypothetical protein
MEDTFNAVSRKPFMLLWGGRKGLSSNVVTPSLAITINAMTKFQSTEATLQSVHPDFKLQEVFSEFTAEYSLFLQRKQGETNRKFGRRKASLTMLSKKAIEPKHGYTHFHKWEGGALTLRLGIYWS